MKPRDSTYLLHLSYILSPHGVHLYALCSGGVQGPYLCAKMLLFSAWENRYTTATESNRRTAKTAVLRNRCITGKGEFIMARVYNFSAGPACCPKGAAAGTGRAAGIRRQRSERHGDEPPQQVVRCHHQGHRGFPAPGDEHSRQLQGGLLSGRCYPAVRMVPLNFMTTGKADYIVSGNFSGLAAKEAAKFGEARSWRPARTKTSLISRM